MCKALRPHGGTLLVVFSMMVSSLMTQSISAQDKEKAASEKAPVNEMTTEESIGYFLGFSVGQNMVSQGFKKGDFDVPSLSKGLNEALAGGEPNLTQTQLSEISGKIESILQARQESQMAELKKTALLNKEKSELYMQQNSKKEGVKTLEGGVQYEVLKSGDGGSPSMDDTVSAHYTGRLTSGKVFDSSVDRGEPMEFKVGGVIKGWQAALQKMKVGDKWKLHVPPELAYGEQGVVDRNGAPVFGPDGERVIGPNEALVFEVELLEIK